MALRGEHESVKRMLEDKSRELNGLLKEHEASLVANIESATTISELQQSVELLQSAQTRQDDELFSLRSNLADHAEIRHALGKQAERLERITAQRDEALKSQAALDESESRLRTQNSSLSQQVRKQLASENSQVAESSEIQTQTVVRLQEELRQQASWREKHAELHTRIEENVAQRRRVMAERDKYRAASKDAESRIRQLESKSRASEETVRYLRRERSAILTRVRQPSADTFTSRTKQPFNADTAGGQMRRDEVLGMVYTQPPNRKDDLKRISGIAQVLERKLNAFGVYT